MKCSVKPRRTGVSRSEVATAWILAGVFMLGLLAWSLNHDVSYSSSETTATNSVHEPALLSEASSYRNESHAQMDSVH